MAEPWLPGRQPLGRAGAAGERAAAGADGELGPFGKSQALFSIVNKEREISPSADASADTQVLLGGGGEGGEKMPFLPPGEYLRGLYVGCERGILGGQERKGRGLWGEEREESPSTRTQGV